jgi:hypothetical protein
MQAAVGGDYVEAGVLREQPKHRRKILDGVPEDVEHAITAIRHSGLPDFSPRCGGTRRKNVPNTPPGKKVTVICVAIPRSS